MRRSSISNPRGPSTGPPRTTKEPIHSAQEVVNPTKQANEYGPRTGASRTENQPNRRMPPPPHRKMNALPSGAHIRRQPRPGAGGETPGRRTQGCPSGNRGPRGRSRVPQPSGVGSEVSDHIQALKLDRRTDPSPAPFRVMRAHRRRSGAVGTTTGKPPQAPVSPTQIHPPEEPAVQASPFNETVPYRQCGLPSSFSNGPLVLGSPPRSSDKHVAANAMPLQKSSEQRDASERLQQYLATCAAEREPVNEEWVSVVQQFIDGSCGTSVTMRENSLNDTRFEASKNEILGAESTSPSKKKLSISSLTSIGKVFDEKSSNSEGLTAATILKKMTTFCQQKCSPLRSKMETLKQRRNIVQEALETFRSVHESLESSQLTSERKVGGNKNTNPKQNIEEMKIGAERLSASLSEVQHAVVQLLLRLQDFAKDARKPLGTSVSLSNSDKPSNHSGQSPLMFSQQTSPLNEEFRPIFSEYIAQQEREISLQLWQVQQSVEAMLRSSELINIEDKNLLLTPLFCPSVGESAGSNQRSNDFLTRGVTAAKSLPANRLASSEHLSQLGSGKKESSARKCATGHFENATKASAPSPNQYSSASPLFKVYKIEESSSRQGKVEDHVKLSFGNYCRTSPRTEMYPFSGEAKGKQRKAPFRRRSVSTRPQGQRRPSSALKTGPHVATDAINRTDPKGLSNTQLEQAKKVWASISTLLPQAPASLSVPVGRTESDLHCSSATFSDDGSLSMPKAGSDKKERGNEPPMPGTWFPQAKCMISAKPVTFHVSPLENSARNASSPLRQSGAAEKLSARSPQAEGNLSGRPKPRLSESSSSRSSRTEKIPQKISDATKSRRASQPPLLDATAELNITSQKRRDEAVTLIAAQWKGYTARSKYLRLKEMVSREREGKQQAHCRLVARRRIGRAMRIFYARTRLTQQTSKPQPVVTKTSPPVLSAPGKTPPARSIPKNPRDRFQRTKEQRRNLILQHQKSSNAAAVNTSNQDVSPPPLVAPLPLLEKNISTKNISAYYKDSESYELLAAHRLLQAPPFLRYLLCVITLNNPQFPPMGYASLKGQSSPTLEMLIGKVRSKALNKEKEISNPMSPAGLALMIEHKEWGTKSTSYTVPYRVLRALEPPRVCCSSLTNESLPILSVMRSPHWSYISPNELRSNVPVSKKFKRPFENWGVSNALVRRIFTAAAIYSWKLIFSHTAHDDFKQQQLKTPAEKAARLERVEIRNRMILACYCVHSEREWMREASKDISFVSQIWNPKKSLDPNDPDFARHCKETYDFVEDFLYQCFPTVSTLEEVPSFLIGAGIYFILRESLNYSEAISASNITTWASAYISEPYGVFDSSSKKRQKPLSRFSQAIHQRYELCTQLNRLSRYERDHYTGGVSRTLKCDPTTTIPTSPEAFSTVFSYSRGNISLKRFLSNVGLSTTPTHIFPLEEPAPKVERMSKPKHADVNGDDNGSKIYLVRVPVSISSQKNYIKDYEHSIFHYAIWLSRQSREPGEACNIKERAASIEDPNFVIVYPPHYLTVLAQALTLVLFGIQVELDVCEDFDDGEYQQ